ncbi:hypothetical protein Namu_3534 [Nakamurella multipartita DSM 44233]|uniref:Uncharacterized protein n=1 Tax=Nakamurella multipartita (strain ATCC 700099 / DSM 44233 / CIP 104796 / JCM 9543 / NBRC 105858 / Y-104) TaxID=479431 RepID=C8XEV8_NAKMY|nr:hypothetical protein Namu_3534 [Nakamurella multipartita DSM 44233]
MTDEMLRHSRGDAAADGGGGRRLLGAATRARGRAVTISGNSDSLSDDSGISDGGRIGVGPGGRVGRGVPVGGSA